MPARKTRVSLPQITALTKHMAQEGKMLVEEARRARKAERSATARLDGKGYDDATARRIAAAGAFATVVETNVAVETVSADGLIETKELPIKRREIRDTPFDRLIARCILAKDAKLNAAYRKSGEELLKDAEIAGLNSVRSIDPGAIGAPRMNDGAFIRSDIQQAALYRVLKAKAVLNDTECRVVDLVLLQRQNVTTAGHSIARGRRDDIAAGIGVYVLQTALHALMDHYGFTPAS